MRLCENDWLTINNMILNMYSHNCKRLFDNDFIKHLQYLIPYDKASFYVHDYEGDQTLCKPNGIGFGEGVLEEKLDIVNNRVPHAWVNFYERSTVVRDSDLFDEKEFANSSYYSSLLINENVKYVLTISLAHDKMRVGVLTLFRERDKGDFSDKEVYIAEQIMDHVACYAYKIYKLEQYNKGVNHISAVKLADQYDLTMRENEVLQLILKGYSTKNICEELHVAEPTAKKHLGSIYSKMKIKNKSELFRLLSADVFKE